MNHGKTPVGKTFKKLIIFIWGNSRSLGQQASFVVDPVDVLRRDIHAIPESLIPFVDIHGSDLDAILLPQLGTDIAGGIAGHQNGFSQGVSSFIRCAEAW